MKCFAGYQKEELSSSLCLNFQQFGEELVEEVPRPCSYITSNPIPGTKRERRNSSSTTTAPTIGSIKLRQFSFSPSGPCLPLLLYRGPGREITLLLSHPSSPLFVHLPFFFFGWCCTVSTLLLLVVVGVIFE